MNFKIITSIFITLFFISNLNFAQINYDTVKAGKYDMGKMWTFDNPPVKYFKSEYGFTPSENWLEKARLSALKFATYCSASFVSEDGLIMTNHHCGRGAILQTQKENEDLLKDGFNANNLNDERKIPDLFVDQLVMIEDVSAKFKSEMDKGKSDEEKSKLKYAFIDQLEEEYSKNTGLICKVVQLYNGGKYSIYGYKRYNDIRLVFSPEFQIASTGWDQDNFTYPRYELDFMFFRAYDENGNPAKIENFYKWNSEGAQPGEPIFVVGNPGKTGRLQTVAQLEFLRDEQHPLISQRLNGVYDAYFYMYQKYPERESELLNMVMSVGNSKKVYEGILNGLRDNYLMAKKKDFERTMRNEIKSSKKLNSKYGDIFDEIEKANNDKKKFIKEMMAYNLSPFFSSQHFVIARDLSSYALKSKMTNGAEKSKNENADSILNKIYPKNFDEELQKIILTSQIKFLIETLGNENELVKNLTGGNKGEAAVNYALQNSILNDKEKVRNLISQGPDAILNSNDPFINFAQESQSKLLDIRNEYQKIAATEEVNNQLLGEAIYEIYGDQIPPDATGTLRIADGVIKGYEYNGTIAPAKTTYYGLYDRFYSFGGKTYPWGLPELWKKKPAELDLKTPLNFASTNDIIGGNSGSAIVNKDLEVIGLVFDGNMESLPGDFIYTTETNRAVAVDSKGLLEAIKDVYKAQNLADELINGKLKR